MKVIGLTGGIGSGKSYVASIFEQLGISVVDADIAARELTQAGQPALQEIAKRYNRSTILTKQGELDRAKLRQIIFNAPEEKAWLESLLHPLVNQSIINQINQLRQQSVSPYVILCSPLLIESEQKKLCDKVIVVDINEEQQIERASLRDNNSTDTIKKIMQTQASRDLRLNAADLVINNQGSKQETKKQVIALHSKLLDL